MEIFFDGEGHLDLAPALTLQAPGAAVIAGILLPLRPIARVLLVPVPLLADSCEASVWLVA